MANGIYQSVIDAVNAILTDTSQKVLTEKVVERLVSFGFSPSVADAGEIAFATMKGCQHLLNETNQTKVPSELTMVYIDMVCGEFLFVRHLTGRLNIETLDLSGIVNSVGEGDTSVSFATEGSDVAKFNSVLQWMMNGEGCDLECYRKFKW